jgi:hypothetical protein
MSSSEVTCREEIMITKNNITMLQQLFTEGKIATVARRPSMHLTTWIKFTVDSVVQRRMQLRIGDKVTRGELFEIPTEDYDGDEVGVHGQVSPSCIRCTNQGFLMCRCLCPVCNLLMDYCVGHIRAICHRCGDSIAVCRRSCHELDF